jgi:hypothetical protein
VEGWNNFYHPSYLWWLEPQQNRTRREQPVNSWQAILASNLLARQLIVLVHLNRIDATLGSIFIVNAKFYRGLSRLHGTYLVLLVEVLVKWCYRGRNRKASIGMGRARTNNTFCCSSTLFQGEKGNGLPRFWSSYHRLQSCSFHPSLAQWHSNDYGLHAYWSILGKSYRNYF